VLTNPLRQCNINQDKTALDRRENLKEIKPYVFHGNDTSGSDQGVREGRLPCTQQAKITSDLRVAILETAPLTTDRKYFCTGFKTNNDIFRRWQRCVA
jgi:hypothetical protein